MNNNKGIKKYIEEMILHEYYISLIIDDLIRYFNFTITEDTIFNDIRTINLINNSGCSITIISKIISFYSEKYLFWEYVGIRFKKNK